MRYIPVNCIRPGMICGKRIIGQNNQLLLNKGATIQEAYIEKILQLGFPGLYIEDNLSDDIEVQDVISNALRARSVKTIKDLFIGAGQNQSPAARIQQLERTVDEMIDQILNNKDVQVNMLDLKIFDDYTYFHSVNVAVLSLLIGISLNKKRPVLRELGMAAILHDIGKVFVDKDILNKPDRLTAEEMNQMMSHSEKGYQYLKQQFSISGSTLDAIIDHHEKIDGSGYPNKKSEQTITESGRIIAVADVYDALTSDRPYRKAMPPAEAIEYLMGGSSVLFDENIVKNFIKKIVPYSPGMTVRLSNNSLAIVIRNHPDACLRPVVRIIQEQGRQVEPYTVDLLYDRARLDVTILGTVADIS